MLATFSIPNVLIFRVCSIGENEKAPHIVYRQSNEAYRRRGLTKKDLRVNTVSIVVDELRSLTHFSYRPVVSQEGRSNFEEITCNSLNEMRSGYANTDKSVVDERGRNNTLRTPQMVLRKRLRRRMNVEISVRESVWLWDSRHGVNVNEIATREGVSIRRVQ